MELLTHYGFVLENNKNNNFAMELSFEEDDELVKDKLYLFSELDEFYLTSDLSTKDMKSFISAMRAVVYEGDIVILKLLNLEA